MDLNLNLLMFLLLSLQRLFKSRGGENETAAGTAASGRRAGPLTLNAEAKLLLLVRDVAGHGADQGHGQGAGHAGNGAGLWRHSWAKERGGEK